MKFIAEYPLLTMIRRKIAHSGLRGLIRDSLKMAVQSVKSTGHEIRERERQFDSKFQVDTTGVIPAVALDINDEEAFQAGRYEPTPVDQFLEIAGEWPDSLDRFVFVDYGCGKGRTLLLASSFPFKRIIGVEFSKRLCSIAKKNIEAFTKRAAPRCSSIDVVCQDARSFSLPLEPCIVYLFYPFNDTTTRECILNIERSLTLKNREIFITYLNPVNHSLFEASSRFTCIKKIDKSKYAHPYYIYATRSPVK